MTLDLWGALAFGGVIGYVAYRTIRRTKTSGLSDIAAVAGAVGGGTITLLFPTGSQAFGAYGIGLAAGFFIYLLISVIVAALTKQLSGVNEWLGETHTPEAAAGGSDIPKMPDK